MPQACKTSPLRGTLGHACESIAAWREKGLFTLFYKSQRSLSYFKRVHRRTKIRASSLSGKSTHRRLSAPGIEFYEMIWLLVASACSLVLLQTVSRGQSSRPRPVVPPRCPRRNRRPSWQRCANTLSNTKETASEAGALPGCQATRMQQVSCRERSTTAVGPTFAPSVQNCHAQMITSIWSLLRRLRSAMARRSSSRPMDRRERHLAARHRGMGRAVR